LAQTKTTDAALDWIAQLPKLESLTFDYTEVTDAGFARLATLTGLTELHLDRTDITDASLAMLSGLRNLRYLDAYHTLISEPGISRTPASSLKYQKRTPIEMFSSTSLPVGNPLQPHSSKIGARIYYRQVANQVANLRIVNPPVRCEAGPTIRRRLTI
jgi:hypothetical protein